MNNHRSWTPPPLNEEYITWSRVIMNRACRALLEPLPCPTLHALEVSGDAWRDFGFASHRTAAYPDYDLCAGPLPERFDVVIAEQVFEHLLYPYRAGRNVLQMLNPGGWLLISVPFLVKVHDYPIDCTRWTALGLKHFLHECGFPLEPIQTGSWGNRECILANFDGWVPYDKAG
jgi:SAM-dependent methyltransferase